MNDESSRQIETNLNEDENSREFWWEQKELAKSSRNIVYLIIMSHIIRIESVEKTLHSIYSKMFGLMRQNASKESRLRCLWQL